MDQLEIIVKESQLEATKAQYILDNFKSYFEIAAEWEAKAKTLVVTREDQKAEMQMARTGRLFLREKRIAVENSRKKLKEESLREGKAIDGIANVLKALIVPIEEHLERQEHFVELQQKAKDDALRAEIEKRMEEERIAKEKSDAEERERLRIENENLKKAAAQKEVLLAVERKKVEEAQAEARAKQEAVLKAERAKAAAKLEEERKKQAAILAKEREEREAYEAKARKEKEDQEKKLTVEREKVETEKRKTAEVARKKLEAERSERERLAEILRNQVTCPKCKHVFTPVRKG